MPKPLLSFLVPSFAGGGAEAVMVRLASELSRRGREVELVVFRDEGPNRRLVREGLRVVDLRTGSMFGAPFAVRRYLRSARPAVLISALPPANLAAAAALRLAGDVGTRLVLTEHASLSAYLRHDRGWRRHVVRLLAPRLYRVADRVVGVCEAMTEDVGAFTGVRRERLRTLYNPALTPEHEAAIRRDAEVPLWPEGDEAVIVTAGRLEPQKDQATLLRALAALQQRRRARLVLFGEGGLRGELERLARELGVAERVQFVGYVPDPLPHWKRADLFVLSSVFEGFGLVLVEALACGLPVVSTDCPVGPREVLADGEHGALVPPGDAQALAEAMERQLSVPVDAEAQRRRARRFSLARSADGYEALVDEFSSSA